MPLGEGVLFERGYKTGVPPLYFAAIGCYSVKRLQLCMDRFVNVDDLEWL